MDKLIPPFHGTMWMHTVIIFVQVLLIQFSFLSNCWNDVQTPSFGRFSTVGRQHGNTMVTNPDRCSILGSTGTRYHYAWPDKGHSTKTTRSCGNSNDLAKVMSKCHGRGLEKLGLWILAANRKHNVRISEVQVKRWIFEVMESRLFFSGSYCTFWVRGATAWNIYLYVMSVGLKLFNLQNVPVNTK